LGPAAGLNQCGDLNQPPVAAVASNPNQSPFTEHFLTNHEDAKNANVRKKLVKIKPSMIACLRVLCAFAVNGYINQGLR
jgi:hypothetical protein